MDKWASLGRNRNQKCPGIKNKSKPKEPIKEQDKNDPVPVA
jgi:hypothetical protein